jgi:hypothetical protein
MGERHAPIERAFSTGDRDSVKVRISIPMAGNCTRPARVATAGGKENEHVVRCRTCPSCLRARQQLWRLRGQWEVLTHRYNWLYTGTFRNQTWDYRPVAQEVTRWLKRLRVQLDRAGYGQYLKYLVMFERHKSGALHVHSLIHRREHAPIDVLRRPWTAGFNDVRMCDVRGAAYVVKYSTKSLLDNTTGTRPRIRASRGYGRAVMLMDREEVQRALADRPPVPTHRTWVHNLREAVTLLDDEQGAQDIWQFMKEIQEHHGTIEGQDEEGAWAIPPGGTIDGSRVDPSTGEINLPYGPGESTRPIPTEALKAIQEARLMGYLHKHQMLEGMSQRLNDLLPNSVKPSNERTNMSTGSWTGTSTTESAEYDQEGLDTTSDQDSGPSAAGGGRETR